MEITGKIISILPLQSGEGRNGAWRKQEYVLQTNEQYPKKICFNFWGDKIDQFALKQDEQIRLSFDVESREFNGKWYTDVRGWKVERPEQQATLESEQSPTTFASPPPPPPPAGFADFPFGSEGDSDAGNDLPF